MLQRSITLQTPFPFSLYFDMYLTEIFLAEESI